MTAHKSPKEDQEWAEDLVNTHHRTVAKWLKDNKTIGEAYSEANRQAAHTISLRLAEVDTRARKDTVEKLRRIMRGEDPLQYRPHDMISMSSIEEVLDDELQALSKGDNDD